LDLINDTKHNDFHPHATLLSLTRKLYALSWVVSFNDTLQKENECADWLAKFGVTNIDFLKWWISLLPQLNITS